VLDPVRSFMHGSQREIYDDARALLEHEEPNFPYLAGDGAARLREILNDPHVYRGSHMQEAKQRLDDLQAQVKARVDEERVKVREQLQQYRARLEKTAEFAALTPKQQQSLQVPFDRLTRELERQRLIAVMRDSLQRFKDEVYPTLLGRMTEWARQEDEFTYGEDEDQEPTTGADEKVEYVSRTALSVTFDAPWLASEEDVERYLEALRETLLQAIKDGKRIQI
jgi:hypothetical protein